MKQIYLDFSATVPNPAPFVLADVTVQPLQPPVGAVYQMAIEFHRRQCGFCGEYDEPQAVMDLVDANFLSKGNTILEVTDKTGAEKKLIWVCRKCQKTLDGWWKVDSFS